MKCNKILKNLCKVVTIILSAASAFSLFACSIKNSSESSDSEMNILKYCSIQPKLLVTAVTVLAKILKMHPT